MAVRFALYCCRVSLLPLCNLMDHCGKWIKDDINIDVTQPPPPCFYLLRMSKASLNTHYTAYCGSSEDDNIWLCWRFLEHIREAAVKKKILGPNRGTISEQNIISILTCVHDIKRSFIELFASGYHRKCFTQSGCRF